ncbi:SDR family oxidoreductase [Mycobacterium attenuatum]|uniref:SDR family oxidoreductase n=1 Tax=Mycobacterium attenuatum TaxID=2341086 RepID=UPI000F016417|nr:SDR family oxidoreductase [Mycobacterium attenuatum]VBA62418.1 Linear gramicidin synthase subunit D [Mycobacterium attenuatum]
MSESELSTILVTGATGFVGGALALQYLLDTDARVYCLVRENSVGAAQSRIEAALKVAARAYGQSDLDFAIGDRVRAVVGDVGSSHGDYEGLPVSLDLVVHAAASLKYADQDVDEIKAINVAGTANIVRLAQATTARLCHVSTAYVAGKRHGEVSETLPLPDPGDSNNEYERSKVAGEKIVAASQLDYQIVRPSIVIGHSETRGATSFSGMYGMLDQLLRFKSRVGDRLGSLLQHRGLALLAEPDTELNLIPIDYVARAIARISRAQTSETVFHVVNGTPPTAATCLNAGFDLLDLPQPRFVSKPTQLSELDRRLQTDFYEVYLRNGKTFLTDNAEKICGREAFEFCIDEHTTRQFLSWYMDSGVKRGERLVDSTLPLA